MKKTIERLIKRTLRVRDKRLRLDMAVAVLALAKAWFEQVSEKVDKRCQKKGYCESSLIYKWMTPPENAIRELDAIIDELID